MINKYLNNLNKIPWLEEPLTTLLAAQARGHTAHALLIYGAAGTGRSSLASQFAAQLLNVEVCSASADVVGDSAGIPEALSAHPDVTHVEPPSDKKSITIDQIRGLIDFLALTSHQKGAKIAIIAPADLLSRAAANALLKTLEEPPGNSVLLLITDGLSRLPATVVSRCQRVRIPKPGPDAGLDWLNAQNDQVDWVPLLAQTGGAPLAALALQRQAGVEHMQAFARHLDDLAAARSSPATISREWQKLNPDVCLDWLYRRVAAEIRHAVTDGGLPLSAKTRHGGLQNGDKMLNMHRSFELLGRLNELRRLKSTGINTELHLANVLTHWYGA